MFFMKLSVFVRTATNTCDPRGVRQIQMTPEGSHVSSIFAARRIMVDTCDPRGVRQIQMTPEGSHVSSILGRKAHNGHTFIAF